MRRLSRVARLCCLLLVAWPAAPRAAGQPPPAQQMRLAPSEGRMIRLPRAAASVILADPAMADVQTISPTDIFVYGKKPGSTTLMTLDAANREIASWRVTVAYSDDDLRALVRAEAGDYPVSLAYTPTGAVLSGQAPNADVAERIRAMAARFVGEGQVLINTLVVGGGIQVNLRVRVAEVSRSVSKQLGINWSAATSAAGNFAVGLLTGGPVAGGAAATNTLFATLRNRNFTASATLDALAAEGLIHLLAEPNLTCISGETASFLAGGQFPIPVQQSLGTTSIEYHNYGVSLEFQPTVLSNDRIAIHVKPEVSQLDPTAGVTENNFNVPAVTIRRADTTIELGSGQSFAIAGLLQDSSSSDINRVPGLGDIPVLGALFRSVSFRRNETELVIIVTPYIVHPAHAPGDLPTAADLVSAPSDFEMVVRGRVAGGRGQAPPAGPAHLRGDLGFLAE